MASVYKRKDGKGWRAVIRMKGYPTVCETFDRKQEADDWAKETERRIKLGQFNFSAHNKHHTYADLLHRMEGEMFSIINVLSKTAARSLTTGHSGSVPIPSSTSPPNSLSKSAKSSSVHRFLTAPNAVLLLSTAIPLSFLPRSAMLSKSFVGSLKIPVVPYPN